ncbi:MAG: response regulator transcription factor [Desulfobulbaceae bacterium]|nr:response regulator transcription factor [Desulfobulbaceae bacterium]
MAKNKHLIFGRQFDCDICVFKDRPIVIVGSNQFAADLLANYIRANKPAITSVVQRIRDIPNPGSMPREEWRLIFIDCHGLDGPAITKLLQTEAEPYLQHDIIALFNLTPGNIDLSAYIDIGVRGFFFESDQSEVMLKGICALKYGEMWVARGVLMEYIAHKPKQDPAEDQEVHLTPREKDILVHLSSGATNEEIAARLFISLHTVKTHVANIRKKLKLENRLQAALWAAKHLK